MESKNGKHPSRCFPFFLLAVGRTVDVGSLQKLMAYFRCYRGIVFLLTSMVGYDKFPNLTVNRSSKARKPLRHKGLRVFDNVSRM